MYRSFAAKALLLVVAQSALAIVSEAKQAHLDLDAEGHGRFLRKEVLMDAKGTPTHFNAVDLKQESLREGVTGAERPSTLSMQVPQNKPDGVVCPTWLHPQIREQNLMPFLESFGANASGFVQQIEELCGNTGNNLMDGYTGSWDSTNPKGSPSANDVRILTALTAWETAEKARKQTQALTWENVSKPHHGQSTATCVENVMDKPLPATPRIMDFGCGSGTDLKAIKAALQVTSDADALCLDVTFTGSAEIAGLTTIPLDATSSSSYKTSLDNALSDTSLNIEGTIHAAISMVAFHHVADPANPQDPKMRTDALNFIRKALAPGGIFLMAEWDNSLTPNRWIHYDLVHLLPSMLLSDGAPSTPSQLEEGTQYLSVADWRALATHNDWEVHEDRSKLPSGLSPEDQANQAGNGDRDFHLVFRKH